MQCPMQTQDGAGFLLAYCGRKLDPVKAAAIGEHLALCESCSEVVRGQRAVWEALDAWEDMDVAPDFNRRLYARIELESRRGFASRWANAALARWPVLSWRPVVATALAAAAMFAVLSVERPEHRKLDGDEPQARMERADLEQVERTLQDLEMLRQLSPKIPPEANSSGSM